MAARTFSSSHIRATRWKRTLSHLHSAHRRRDIAGGAARSLRVGGRRVAMPPHHHHNLEPPPPIPPHSLPLHGALGVPAHAQGLVLFAHGSGSSRFSPRNRFVARVLRDAGLGTLLIDLLSPNEEEADEVTRHHRFDIPMLADRLTIAIEWLGQEHGTADLPIGLFGASTGGGAALVAAAGRPDRVAAAVSRGGSPDLAGASPPLR